MGGAKRGGVKCSQGTLCLCPRRHWGNNGGACVVIMGGAGVVIVDGLGGARLSCYYRRGKKGAMRGWRMCCHCGRGKKGRS